MMRTMKLYEQPKMIVLAFEEDVVTSSGASDRNSFDKGVEDFFEN